MHKGGRLGYGFVLAAQPLQKGKAFFSFAGAQQVQRFGYGDAVEPGAYFRFSLEFVYRVVYLYENFLGQVFGIFGVLQDAEGGVVYKVFMGIYQIPEGGGIARLQLRY